MKLKEKLAKLDQRHGPLYHTEAREWFETGYRVGFEKAREMAIQKTQEWCGEKLGFLECLGEEEVE